RMWSWARRWTEATGSSGCARRILACLKACLGARVPSCGKPSPVAARPDCGWLCCVKWPTSTPQPTGGSFSPGPPINCLSSIAGSGLTSRKAMAQQPVEAAVRERYSQAAHEKVDALCCPIDYDPKYLRVIPQEVLDDDYGIGDPSRH